MNTTDVLRDLVAACVDDERTLLHERRFVDTGRAGALRRLARERALFARDLEWVCDHRMPRGRGSLVEMAREVGREAWVAAIGRNTGDAIASCRHSRARTEARYMKALELPLPVELRNLIKVQANHIHDEADALNQLQF